MNKYVTIELNYFKDLLVEENKGIYGGLVGWIKSEMECGDEIDDLSDSNLIDIITALVDDFIGNNTFTISDDQIDWIVNEIFKKVRAT